MPAAKKTATAKEVTTFTPPKKLAECADLLYSTRQERLVLDRQSEELKGHESILREHIIENLPRSNATGISGKIANAKIEDGELFIVNDWDKLYAYILKEAKKNPGIWALLNRALNQKTVADMFERGTKVPGTEKLIVKKVSCTKIG